MTTSTINLSTFEAISSNKKPPKYENKITTAILRKLLATSIVANNFLGRSKSLAIICMRLDFCSNPSSISILLSENNATSAPEISAEKNNNKNNRTKPVTIE